MLHDDAIASDDLAKRSVCRCPVNDIDVVWEVGFGEIIYEVCMDCNGKRFFADDNKVEIQNSLALPATRDPNAHTS